VSFFHNFKKRLYCFTPEVMLVTLLIEILLALVVFLRYKTTAFSRVAGLTLVFLAFFQTAEYKICAGEYTLLWARMGIAVITFLPILGVHLLSIMNGNARWLRFVYPVAALFALYFMFSDLAVTGATCGGNYVLFYSAVPLYWVYSFYYFGTLFFSLIFSYSQIIKTKSQKKIQILQKTELLIIGMFWNIQRR